MLLAGFRRNRNRQRPSLLRFLLQRRDKGRRNIPTKYLIITKIMIISRRYLLSRGFDQGASLHGGGEISPLMLTDCGLDLVELGHSERREHFGETDHAVA
jgi:hypothetical protein